MLDILNSIHYTMFVNSENRYQMNRQEYNQLRREAYEASKRYSSEANSDGRSSYASHSIRCNFALQEAVAAGNRVPRDNGGKDMFMIQTASRRRWVIQCIKDRNWRREHAPCCLGFYERQLRSALHPLEY